MVVAKDPAGPSGLVMTATYDPSRLSEEYLVLAYERLLTDGGRRSAQRRRKEVNQQTRESSYEDYGSHLRAS